MNNYDSTFPKMVVLSINNVCDFRCIHCFFKKYIHETNYEPEYMDIVLHNKVIDELALYPETVSLRYLAWGEPLLHPKIIDMLKYARKIAKRNKLSLISNGYWMNSLIHKDLLENLNLIEISLDAASDESYKQIRISQYANSFDHIEQNVRDLVSLRNKKKYQTRIAVSFILHDTLKSKTEFALFTKKWEDVVDEIIKRPAHTFKNTIKGTKLPTIRKPCYGLFNRCNINPYGEMTVCYNDWERTNIIGNLNNESIADIWKGAKYKKLREDQCNSIFTGICKECKDYNPNATLNPYELVLERCNL